MYISTLLLRCLIILNSCETGKTLVINVDTQRIDRGDAHIHSQVKLIVIYQHRVGYVLTGYHSLLLWDLLKMIGFKMYLH